ncbi:Partitioning defective protein 6 [Globodera pallida]|nr:Partitioning defective protein 6 [Globodera pallida]
MALVHIKSKFDSEFRRFSIPINSERFMSYSEFRSFIETVHSLHQIPFTLCYTSYTGDLLPITNDDNFRKSLDSARPYLQLLIQRKGESWEEKYGYGTDASDRRRKGLSMLISTNARPNKRNYNISNPEDFRQVSSIIDVNIVPASHRRVKLCKYGGDDRKLGFFIRDGTSLRMTHQGPVKCEGIFISRLVEGGLAESTGLLSVGDEVVEVNGIEVNGKKLDQVADMMVANAHNLIVTIKPANQRNSLQRRGKTDPFGAQGQYVSNQQQFFAGEGSSSAAVVKLGGFGLGTGGGGGKVYPTGQGVTSYQTGPSRHPLHLNELDDDYVEDDDDEEEDEIVDHTKNALKIR